MMVGHKLDFDGYWAVPPDQPVSESGIYCIYAGSPNHDNSKKPIYIGQTEDLKKRFRDHEKLKKWERTAGCRPLFYSFAKFDEDHLDDVEWAMIYEHQPICNDRCRKNPPDNQTTVTVNGDTAGLHKKFIV